MDSALIDIHQILNLLNIKAESKGDEYVARCPFHSEKTPSWNISKNYPFLFHCFGCGSSGNIYSLVRKRTGKSLYEFLDIKDGSSFEFSNSLRMVSNASITEYRKNDRLTIREGQLRNPLENSTVMEYLESRGIDETFIRYFDVSYADFVRVNTTRLYNRIIIPVTYKNKLINIEARDFTRRSKKKVIYPRGGVSDTLFNFDRLDFNRPIYCTEGIFDLPALFKLGERNLTCIFGTALGKFQSKLLSEIKNLVYMPDNDASGIAILDSIDDIMLNEWEIAFLPSQVKDPGEANKQQILETLEHKIEAVEYFSEKHLGKKEKLDW